MKLKQSLIDNLVSSDWTREKLAEEILMARFFSGKYKAEANWLDQLSDMLRDDEGSDEQTEERIYKEYEEAIAKNKETYREKNCNES
jgi:hypothetical protein|tara:strand:+ start:525 stop:785 length:261 start_codon:yes stop_codon:yes gene_type:complete